MVAFSISETATAGFGLIRRKPLTVLGWGLFLFVVGVLPILAALAWIVSHLGGFADLEDLGERELFARLLPVWMGAMGLYLFMIVGSVIAQAMVICAVFRAVLEPSKRAFGYLRLGAQELWVGLSLIVAHLLLGIVVGIAWTPVAVACALLIASHQETAAAFVGFFGGLAVFAGVVWLMLRLSMAAPLSFAERRFAFFESWDLTKGQSGRLLLTALLTLVFILLTEVAVGLVFFVAMVATGAASYFTALSGADPSDWTVNQLLAFIGPMLGVGGLIYILFAGIVLAVSLAPWATAYKSLAAGMVREPGVA